MSPATFGENLRAASSRRFELFVEGKTAYEEYLAAAALPTYPHMSPADIERAREDRRLYRAERALQEAIRISFEEDAVNDAATALLELGMLLHCQGRFPEALGACQACLDIFETMPQLDIAQVLSMSGALYHLGVIKARTGHRSEGLELLRRAREVDHAFMDVAGMALDCEAIELFEKQAEHV